MVHDKDSGKPKGYCFIEFEHERDMHCKYTKFSLSENMIRLTQEQFWGQIWTVSVSSIDQVR